MVGLQVPTPLQNNGATLTLNYTLFPSDIDPDTMWDVSVVIAQTT